MICAMPRKPEYTEEIGEDICVRLADGESLRSICSDDDMPNRATVFRWLLRDDPEFEAFRDQYTRAREMQADAHADDIQDIADDGTNDWMEKFDKDGNSIGWQINGEAVQRSKLRVDARKWTASKLKPKKYGDKIDVTSGGEAIAPTETEAAVRLAKIMEKYGGSDNSE